MLKAKRQGPLYRRGQYTLDWHRRRDGTLRTPYLTVFWYDPPPKRCGRSASTGTADVEEAKTWLDAFYLERTTGQAICPTCGQLRHGASGFLVTRAIANYQLLHADRLPSANAISARLAHVVDYITTLPSPAIPCEAVDEGWVARFREWAERQAIVSSKGNSRPRSLGTVENSVIQLSAAIRFAQRRGDTLHGPRFRAQSTKELSRTPEHRSDVAELAAMFRYCVSPQADSEPERKRRIREREALRRFLMVSIATLARPDAAHDVSTDPKRRQWNGKARILSLNPKGRRQTKKRRATVPVAWQVALHLDAEPAGWFVGPKSIRSAWRGMAAEIGLPDEGEAGTKLIRRSMAHLLRHRGVPVEQLEMMLGHRAIESTSELYAPFSPVFLADARAAIEAVFDEIETLAPGALRRTCAEEGADIIPIGWRKNG